MDRFVVTVQRQFGSRGRQIARRMSELLKVSCHDRDIAEQAAEKLGLPASVVEEAEEKAHRQLSFESFSQLIMPPGKNTTQMQDEIFKAQEEVIRNFAERESCVVVGRCSDFVLDGFDRVMNVYIYAAYDARLSWCETELRLDGEKAKETIHREDEERNSYHMQYTGYLPDDRNHKDILIDSALLGPEETAELLAEAVRRRFGRRN